ncbi:hypothetical protein [Bradyrhizobium sp. th.b2]|uniref:hypothetical protein n=1 Tax=Bradyrhizobium sp. th-b2 TaxID=172088 RepID=UPI00048FA2E2|nr:hypothetical protein [Bradyrhizobium sp. th.b2]
MSVAAARQSIRREAWADLASTRPEDRVARLRSDEVTRLIWVRDKGRLPDDDNSRRLIAFALAHLARLANAGERISSFLARYADWMPDAQRRDATAAAFASSRRWGADAAARELGVTFAERTSARLRTIGSIDVDAEARAAIQKDKRRQREKERRLRERLSGQPRLSKPERRLAAILSSLPPEGWWDIGSITQELIRSKSVAFDDLGKDTGSLRPAVHRAVKYGVEQGTLETRIVPGTSRIAETLQVRRAPLA